jgi:hypothetical protein
LGTIDGIHKFIKVDHESHPDGERKRKAPGSQPLSSTGQRLCWMDREILWPWMTHSFVFLRSIEE